jgi:hypothetical protein
MGWFSKQDDGFFLSTVVPTPDMARIGRVLGMVHGEAIIGANIFRDLFSSVRDVVGGRAGGYERALSGARDAALRGPDRGRAREGRRRRDRRRLRLRRARREQRHDDGQRSAAPR